MSITKKELVDGFKQEEQFLRMIARAMNLHCASAEEKRDSQTLTAAADILDRLAARIDREVEEL